jgi:hypothetical protein
MGSVSHWYHLHDIDSLQRIEPPQGELASRRHPQMGWIKVLSGNLRKSNGARN